MKLSKKTEIVEAVTSFQRVNTMPLSRGQQIRCVDSPSKTMSVVSFAA